MMLVATREVWYAGKTRLPGETFETNEKDGKLLKAIKKAEDASTAETMTQRRTKVGAPVKPKDTGNSAPISPTTPSNPPPRVPRYQSRQMRAAQTEPAVSTGAVETKSADDPEPEKDPELAKMLGDAL